MTEDLQRLRRWLRRARPPKTELLRALAAGFVATATNVALLVGAIALLVDSAARPGLRAVAVALVVIELFAFLRSPLRFAERLEAHRLGFRAVSRWRRWLVLVVGQLNYSQWRAYASGDLLERALGDTDELQDLWLRFVIPFVDVTAVMVLGDIVIAALPPHGQWWAYALNLAALQFLGVVGLCALARGDLASDRVLRRARGAYRAQLVELSAATPELALLGHLDLAERRSAAVVRDLARAESVVVRRRRLASGLVLGTSLLALAALASHPATSRVWLVVSAVIGLSTFEALTSIRLALRAAVEVNGGGERLEAMAIAPPTGSTTWRESTLRLDHVRIEEAGRVLVGDATLNVPSGSRLALVGESGVGKSTLLRALVRLDDVQGGTITWGGVALGDLRDDEFRHHVAYVASEPGLTRGFAHDVVTLGRATTRDSFRDLVALGITAERTTKFEELSRGERVRVALARAVVTNPDVVVVDEPTAGLGREETRDVLSFLGASGATVVVATHDADVIEWCDLVVELRDGELVIR
jgi:ABC-type transport system involved in cytochrome bd biosynthesis fused ATPase/permease subunit